jgi:hypothetical protein
MNIFKLVLLSSLTFVFFGILRAALFIYILLLPDSPLGGVAPDGDVRTRDSASNARAGSRCHANIAQTERILLPIFQSGLMRAR